MHDHIFSMQVTGRVMITLRLVARGRAPSELWTLVTSMCVHSCSHQFSILTARV